MYEVAKELVTDAWWSARGHRPAPEEASPAIAQLTAGGLAGVTTWASTYPADVIKSALQTLPEGTSAADRRAVAVARRIYLIEGWR